MSQDKKKLEKPKNWIERIAEKVGFVKKDAGVKKPYDIASLADGSVQLYQDRKLAERLDATEVLDYVLSKPLSDNLSPKAKVKILKEQLDILNKMIQLIAVPWARANDNPSSSKLIHGWNKLFGTASSWITRVDMYFTENDTPINSNSLDGQYSKILSDNNIVVHDLQLSLMQHIFPDARDVLGYCFRDEDVRPMAVTVIQSMIPMQQGFGGENIGNLTKNMGYNNE